LSCDSLPTDSPRPQHHQQVQTYGRRRQEDCISRLRLVVIGYLLNLSLAFGNWKKLGWLA
jgi:hypothetical protein